MKAVATGPFLTTASDRSVITHPETTMKSHKTRRLARKEKGRYLWVAALIEGNGSTPSVSSEPDLNRLVSVEGKLFTKNRQGFVKTPQHLNGSQQGAAHGRFVFSGAARLSRFATSATQAAGSFLTTDSGCRGVR